MFGSDSRDAFRDLDVALGLTDRSPDFDAPKGLDDLDELIGRLVQAGMQVEADVQLDCRGRVVRNFEEDGRRGVGVVIDEYHFERR